MEKKVGRDRKGGDRHLIADLQCGEQFRQPGIVVEGGSMRPRELADADDDGVGDGIGGGGEQWLILDAAKARCWGRYG